MMKRRDFIQKTSLALASTAFSSSVLAASTPGKKMRLAIVGTGIRAIIMWGKYVRLEYGDEVEFVALCDSNLGRAQAGRKFMGVKCPVFDDFELMMKKIKPDYLLVCSTDDVHDYHIIKGMEMGADIITEKPLTINEVKLKAILDAEKKFGKKITVTFNYRHGIQMTKIKEFMAEKVVGDVVSVDLNWYLNTSHGADYFRRWHAYKNKSNSLLVHKSTHHFDLINWFIDSDPLEVSAYGSLDFYGKNSKFRHTHCRTCPYQKECKFYFDITKDKLYMDLYVANEATDGYIRDACVFREDIDIYDKMSVQVKYANGVLLNYSLSTYSPFEGFRLAINGKEGRLDTWEGIPYQTTEVIDQVTLHTKEMKQDGGPEDVKYDDVVIQKLFEESKTYKIKSTKRGHGGGDQRMKERIFKTRNSPDPLNHMASTRDGAMSIIIGIAARKSIEQGKPIKISDLTDIPLMAKRPN